MFGRWNCEEAVCKNFINFGKLVRRNDAADKTKVFHSRKNSLANRMRLRSVPFYSFSI